MSENIKAKIKLLHNLSNNVNDILKTYSSIDKTHSEYFLHDCAEKHHKKLFHKVYLVLLPESQEILGYTSIHVKDEEGKLNNERIHFPFLDIAYLSVCEELNIDLETSSEILETLLETIERVGIKIAERAGCCFIRANIPFSYNKREKPIDTIKGSPLTPWTSEILEKFQYIDLERANKNFGIKFKRPYRINKDHKVVLKYFIRSLNFIGGK
jgi:hypothetical protein